MKNKKYKILLAEDDQFLCKALKDKLKRDNFSVNLVSNGNEVLPAVKKDKPDLILLDIMMPGKNGFEVIQEVRSEEDFKNLPIIIISNLGQENDIKKGIELGAVGYIVKSDLSISEVAKKAREYLEDIKK